MVHGSGGEADCIVVHDVEFNVVKMQMKLSPGLRELMPSLGD